MLVILDISSNTPWLNFQHFVFYKNFKPKYAGNISIEGEIK